MATKAHCAYCIESLAANFEHRQQLSLAQVEDLWSRYHATNDDDNDTSLEHVKSSAANDEGEDSEMTDAETDGLAPARTTAKPAAISRLLNSQSASSSSSSIPSIQSSVSGGSKTRDNDSSGAATPASSKSSHSSSRSSLFSFGRKEEQLPKREQTAESHPLFVTWNTVSKSGYKSLRGCIGTFEPQELEAGLRSYALTSAFEDVRFQPIPASQLPSLSCDVTLLTDFSPPTTDPLDWTVGTHGIRISFSHHSRRYGATYLPSVAREQGWTKEETLVSLMRKSGWNGSSLNWLKTWREGKGELVRYEGNKIEVQYSEWRAWRNWVDELEDKGRGST